MNSEITPGARFPDFELPDHNGTDRKLSFLQGNDPMILTLHRGIYCPKDRQQLFARGTTFSVHPEAIDPSQ